MEEEGGKQQVAQEEMVEQRKESEEVVEQKKEGEKLMEEVMEETVEGDVEELVVEMVDQVVERRREEGVVEEERKTPAKPPSLMSLNPERPQEWEELDWSIPRTVHQFVTRFGYNPLDVGPTKAHHFWQTIRTMKYD